MQVKFLKTIRNSHFGGLLREGRVLTVPDEQARAWIRNGIAVPFVEPTLHAPPVNAALPGAPENAAMGNAPSEEPIERRTRGRATVGAAKSSSSRRQAPRSRRKT